MQASEFVISTHHLTRVCCGSKREREREAAREGRGEVQGEPKGVLV